MKRLFIVLSIFIASINPCEAQLGEWLYSADSSLQFNVIVADDSGYIYAAGTSCNYGTAPGMCNSFSFRGQHYTSPNIPHSWGTSNFIFKMDSTGTILWSKIFGSYDWMHIGAMGIDNNNDLVMNVSFNTYLKLENDTIIGPVSTRNNGCLVKYSGSGVFQWARVIGANSYFTYQWGKN